MVQQISMENLCTEIQEKLVDDSKKCPTSSSLQKESSEEAENVFSVYNSLNIVDFSSPADTWKIGEVGEEQEESVTNEEPVGVELELKMVEHWLEWTNVLHNPGFETIEDDVFASNDAKDVNEAEDLKLLAGHEVPQDVAKIKENHGSIEINKGTMASKSTLIGETGICGPSDDDSDEKQSDLMISTEVAIKTSPVPKAKKRQGDSLDDGEIPKVRRISDSSDPTDYCFKSVLERRAVVSFRIFTSQLIHSVFQKLVPGTSLEDALEIARRRATARIEKSMERSYEYNAQNRMMKEFESENPWTGHGGWTNDVRFEF
ncbi:hypothetical protein CRE_09581 [Caenorhabditis remanei]|uniref:Uncharacterized protein n=1 Tax=Caenorhabditis remanei TaxID=31234 RepID=E3MIZ1_CAERE|nr:hypothetical protein CRE_09581 [Caenorhabditis remanei]